MPRKRTLGALAAILLLACAGVFLAQPKILRQRSRSGQQQQQLRHFRQEVLVVADATEGGNAPLTASPPAPTPPPTMPILAAGGALPTAPRLAPPIPPPPPPPLPPPPPPPILPTFDFAFDYPLVVKKKAVSSRMRVVFLVGLEGTGHHYLADVLEHICKTASVPCPKMCLVAKALYPELSVPKTKGDYEGARRHLRREMEKLAAYAEEHLPEGKATTASFGPCRFQAGMMSYPNFNGVDKPLQYVDFRLLAEEAERAGVDMRLVYLSRSARGTLISDTQHRPYGGTFMREARVLLNNAAVIESTFRELDPSFTTCFRYEDMADPAQASRVAHFVAPTESIAQRIGNKMLANVKLKGRLPNDGRNPGSGDLSMELVVARLQQKLDRIERDVCPMLNGTAVVSIL